MIKTTCREHLFGFVFAGIGIIVFWLFWAFVIGQGGLLAIVIGRTWKTAFGMNDACAKYPHKGALLSPAGGYRQVVERWREA